MRWKAMCGFTISSKASERNSRARTCRWQQTNGTCCVLTLPAIALRSFSMARNYFRPKTTPLRLRAKSACGRRRTASRCSTISVTAANEETMKTAALLLLTGLAIEISATEPAVLKLTQTIPLPGVKGRFDHFSIDAKGRRLFVAALGNNTLEVLDLAAGKHLKSITGLHKPTGVLYLPEPNQVAV